MADGVYAVIRKEPPGLMFNANNLFIINEQEQARKSVNLEEFRQAFAGDSQNKSFIFQNYVTAPGVEAAFRQATMKP